MAEGAWDREGNDFIERLMKLVLPSLNRGLEEALSDVFRLARFFISFNDLSRMILLKLEEKVRLPEQVKDRLLKELEDIYRKTQAQLPLNIMQDDFFDFRTQDLRTINYALKLNDFYLGKFFQGDREIRLRALSWMSRYYLEEGNPIGRGQKGIKEFLERFKEYIQPQTEWKARQIIDTSVNYLRNSARLRAFQKAQVKYYRWDAVGDRLTCPVCRSLDGRVFRTEDSVKILDTIESSEDPTIIRDLKPILNKPWTGPTDSIPNRWPPAHPLCRCRIVAYEEEEELPVIVERPPGVPDTPLQRELEQEYSVFTKAELTNRIKAHLGSEWARPPAEPKEKDIRNFLGKYLEKHFEKHHQKVGAKTIEEYKNMAYNVIRNPDRVYVERNNGGTYYIFFKGDLMVATSDDNLSITSFYRIKEEEWIKRRVQTLSSAILRIL